MNTIHSLTLILGASIFLTGGLAAQVSGTPGHLDVYEATLACGGEPELVIVSPEGAITVIDRMGFVVRYSSEFALVDTVFHTGDSWPSLVEREWLAAHRQGASSADGWTAAVLPNDHQIEVTGENGTFRIGDFGARNGLFSRPRGVTIHGEKIFVADTSNHRIQVFTKDGVPLYRFGLHQLEPRQGEGRLHYPVSVTISPDGERAFVCEPLEGRVQVFRARTAEDPPPSPASTWDRADLPAHFGEHWAVNGEWLLIAEPDAERVSLYQIREGKEPVRVSELGGIPGTRLGQFRNPGTIAALPASGVRSRFLIHDRGNERWQVIEVEPQSGPAKFSRRMLRVVSAVSLERAGQDPVTFLATDEEGCVYTATGERVEKRTARGEPIEAWSLESPAQGFTVAAGTIYAVLEGGTPLERRGAPRQQIISLHGDPGEGSVTVLRTGTHRGIEPAGIARLRDGSVLSDRQSHRLVFVGPDGDFRRFIGSAGTGPAQFHHPRALSVDHLDRIWVLDHGNHRGQVLDADGNFLWAFGSKAYLKPIFDAQKPAAPRRGEEE